MPDSRPPPNPPGLYHRLIKSVFQLKDDEISRVSWMFLYSLLAVGAFILGRIIRDTLLLSLPKTHGVSRLPWLMALAAVAVSTASYFYSKYTNKMRRDQMIIWTNVILLAVLLFIYQLLVVLPASWGLHPYILQFNYVYVEVMGALQVIQFWTLASELFDPRSAKRSFAIIGGGAVLANLLAFGVRPMVKWLSGAVHMLPLLALMLGLCIIVVYWIGRQNQKVLVQLFLQKQRKTPERAKININNDTERIRNHRQLKAIAAIILLTFLTTTLIDYQFKVLAATAYQNDAGGLSAYFGLFYGVTGILACILQFVFASRILERFGIQTGLMLLPLALLVGSILLVSAPAILPVFLAFSFAKGSENVLRYTINDVSVNLLYVPVPSHLRARAKVFIDGILKPGAIGISAGLIMVMTKLVGWNVQQLSWLAAIFIGAWIFMLTIAHREYVATLLRSMQKKHLQLDQSRFSIQDDSAVRALRKVLRSQNTEQILHALQLLPHIQRHRWNYELFDLLDYQDDEVRIQALRTLAALNTTSEEHVSEYKPLRTTTVTMDINPERIEARIMLMMQTDNPLLRAQSIETLCALLGDEAIQTATQFLDDDSIEVRSSAIVGLIQFGGLDGILQAATHLKELLEHEDAHLRDHAAKILGRLGARNFYQPVLRLLEDDALEVRISAIEAAGKIRSPKLAKPLLEQLGDPKTSKAAVRALVAYGPSLLPRLGSMLSSEGEEKLQESKALVRIIGQIGTQQAIDQFQDYLPQSPRPLRLQVLQQIQRLSNKDPALLLDQQRLRQLFLEELRQHYTWSLDGEVIEASFAHAEVLSDALHERLAQSLELLFGYLSLLYPARQIQLIFHQLKEGSPRVKSNAIELLDNLLENETKRQLLPLLERDGSLREIAADRFQLKPSPLEAIIARLHGDSSPWLRSCLLHTIGQNKLEAQRALVQASFDKESGMVKETALSVLETFLSGDEYRALLTKAAEAPGEPLVARFAAGRRQELQSSPNA